MDFFRNRTAWVTGSSRGIGRAVAEALAAEGANVVLHGRTDANLRQTGEGDSLAAVAAEMGERHGVRVFAVTGDLTDENEAKRMADEIRAVTGGVDFLVCNAGGGNVSGGDDPKASRGNALDFDPETFRRRLEQNFLATVFACREAVPDMIRKGFGRVITIGSIAACGGNKTNGYNAAYPAAKAAVHEYTRCLAGQLRHAGIPVNCIVPGNIDTPYTRLAFGGERITPNPEHSRLEGIGKAEDIAALAVFLCGPGAAYISGQLIRVDGGEQLFPC